MRNEGDATLEDLNVRSLRADGDLSLNHSYISGSKRRRGDPAEG
jgi:hypothetical protein